MNAIQAFTKAQSMSPLQLAEAVGVSRDTVYCWISGKHFPKSLVAKRLAEVLGCRVEDLGLASFTPIRAARTAAGYTQERLAQEIGVTKGTISNWESGTSSPEDEMLIKAALALRCTAYDLVGDKLISAMTKRRLEKNLPLKIVAAELHTDSSSLYKWENGYPLPEDKTLFKMAAMYSCRPGDLLPDGGENGALKKARLNAHLTRKDVSRVLGVRTRTVTRWERGVQVPFSDNFYQLSRLYGCRAEELGMPQRERLAFSVEERNEIVADHLNMIWWVIGRNRNLLRAIRAEKDDAFQALAVRLVQCVDTYNPEKGNLITHIRQSLEYEMRTFGAQTGAHGLKGVPREERPIMVSFELMASKYMEMVGEVVMD